jgi:hypothetical protein
MSNGLPDTPYGTDDPTLGLYSATNATYWFGTDPSVSDGMNQIVGGACALSAIQVSWSRPGPAAAATKIRSEYLQALASTSQPFIRTPTADKVAFGELTPICGGLKPSAVTSTDRRK